MSGRKEKDTIRSVEIDSTPEGLERGLGFIDKLLGYKGVSKAIINETMLIFEALYRDIIRQAEGSDVRMTITAMGRLSDIRFKIDFKGDPYIPSDASEPDDGDPSTEPDSMLRDFAEKISCTYHAGRNNIYIYVKRNHNRLFFACMVGVAIAVFLTIVLNLTAGTEAKEILLKGIAYPIEALFTNAMLMLAGPVTFFSLLKNLTDTYVLTTNEGGLRQLHKRVLLSSVTVIIAAVALSFVIRAFWVSHVKVTEGYGSILKSGSPYDLVNSLIPDSIIAPFETMSPFPLIFVAILTTAAFCTSVRSFDLMKNAIDACHELFSGMLAIVMTVLPVAACTAFLDILSNSDKELLRDLLLFLVVVTLSPVVLWLIGAIRLKAGGVSVPDFHKKIKGLVIENLKINSVIDAVPFNVRYCSDVFGMDGARIKGPLRFLSHTNLDGNCFLITLTAMLLLIFNRTDFSYLNVAVIAILALFLSLGAPNQPGGIMIGLVIIFNYMSASELLSMAICCEVFFGWIQNLINVIGDIIIVATLDPRDKGKPGAERPPASKSI